MTLDEIKKAVNEGKTVHWYNSGCKVILGENGMYLIHRKLNNYYTGLTWADGVTMNGEPHEFYLAK